MNGLLSLIVALPMIWLAVLAAPLISYVFGRIVCSPAVWGLLIVLIVLYAQRH